MVSSESRTSMMDIVLQFFQEDQWNHQRIEDKPVVRAGFRGERGTWVCYARVDEAHHRFIFHSLLGLNIQPQYRPAVCDYLMRANLCLPLGSFEMDPGTGEVRYKAGVETPEGELTVAMVRAIAYTGLRVMDHYYPGVLAVVHAGLSPEAALARVEAQVAEGV